MEKSDFDLFRKIGIHRNECPEYYDFCDSIYQNRFFCDPENSIFKAISEAKQEMIGTLYQGQSVYRARVVPFNMNWERQKGFDILNEKELGAPPTCSEGRGNPAYTSRLYVADSPYCALSEVRPACGATVAIGHGHAVRDLKYLSFIKWPTLPCSDIVSTRRRTIIEVLNTVFATPVIDNKDYLPTQVIAEYVRTVLKLDGIAYSSTQCEGGINYFLFNPLFVKFQSSHQAKIENVSYTGVSYSPQFSCLTNQKREWKS